MQQWRSRQSKRLSPLRSWVRFSPRTHVKSVCQRPAESRGFSRGAPNPPPPHRESWQGGQALKYRSENRLTKCSMTLNLGRTYVL